MPFYNFIGEDIVCQEIISTISGIQSTQIPKEIPVAPNAVFQRAKLIQSLNLPVDRVFPDGRIGGHFGHNYVCNEIKASIHSVIVQGAFGKNRLSLKLR